MEKRTLPLVSPTHRKFAASWCLEAPEGWSVEFRPQRRSDEANRRMHAMLRDIAKQVQWCGAMLSTEDWKRIATAMLKKDKFVRDVGEDGQPGNGLIVIGAQTRDMSGKEIGLVIDWCDWFGTQHGIVWSDEEKKVAVLEEMRR
jgi:hypothetical protein